MSIIKYQNQKKSLQGTTMQKTWGTKNFPLATQMLKLYRKVKYVAHIYFALSSCNIFVSQYMDRSPGVLYRSYTNFNVSTLLKLFLIPSQLGVYLSISKTQVQNIEIIRILVFLIFLEQNVISIYCLSRWIITLVFNTDFYLDSSLVLEQRNN